MEADGSGDDGEAPLMFSTHPPTPGAAIVSENRKGKRKAAAGKVNQEAEGSRAAKVSLLLASSSYSEYQILSHGAYENTEYSSGRTSSVYFEIEYSCSFYPGAISHQVTTYSRSDDRWSCSNYESRDSVEYEDVGVEEYNQTAAEFGYER